jgi:hypothetical protein
MRWLPALVSGLLIVGVMTSCSRQAQNSEQVRVTRAFNAWKDAMIKNQIGQAMSYLSSNVDDYFQKLNSPPPAPADSKLPPSQTPGVDLLLRTALEKKVPPDLRANLTFGSLLQRITDQKLFDSRNVREIALGRVSVTDDHANAEIYYQGMLTALRLPFVKENGEWKIDVLAILPYAEILMRVDRAIKNESQAQQVDQLVSKLPSL